MRWAEYTMRLVLGSLVLLALWWTLPLAQQTQEGRLVIDHAPFTRPQRRGVSLAIEAAITSPVGVRKAEVFCRAAAGGDFAALPMEPVGHEKYRAIVPDWMTAGVGLEYYITATDERGQSASQGFVGFPLFVRFLSDQAPTQEERLKSLQETLDSLRKSREENFNPSTQPQVPTNRVR
ncbi:MAG: hypothetical protein AB7N91_09970 [Candidatus Tectimicrobiota bacterium]